VQWVCFVAVLIAMVLQIYVMVVFAGLVLPEFQCQLTSCEISDLPAEELGRAIEAAPVGRLADLFVWPGILLFDMMLILCLIIAWVSWAVDRFVVGSRHGMARWFPAAATTMVVVVLALQLLVAREAIGSVSAAID
jgi:hypothetical protein